jgi:hypothetical protein
MKSVAIFIIALITGCGYNQADPYEIRYDTTEYAQVVNINKDVRLVVLSDDDMGRLRDDYYAYGHAQKNVVLFVNNERLGIILMSDQADPRRIFVSEKWRRFAGITYEPTK